MMRSSCNPVHNENEDKTVVLKGIH